MYTINMLQAHEVQSFEKFTYQASRETLRSLSSSSDTYAFGAQLLEKPIGLLWGELAQDKKTFRVEFFYVVKKYRQKRVATSLLESLEAWLQSIGSQKIEMSIVHQPLDDWLERMLQRRGFRQDESRPMIKFQVDLRRFLEELKVINQVRLPEAFTVFSWGKLTQTEREELLQAKNSWYPEELTPFRNESLIDPDISLGLRYKDEVIGWCMNHKYTENTYICDSAFTKEPYQNLGRSIPLMANSVKKAYEANYKYAIFYVNDHNYRMLHFVSRKMEKVCTRQEVRKMVKQF